MRLIYNLYSTTKSIYLFEAYIIVQFLNLTAQFSKKNNLVNVAEENKTDKIHVMQFKKHICIFVLYFLKAN